MGWTERLSTSTRATLHFRGEPYGVPGDSRYDLYQEGLAVRGARVFGWLARYLAA
jgi:hypothetical protein